MEDRIVWGRGLCGDWIVGGRASRSSRPSDSSAPGCVGTDSVTGRGPAKDPRISISVLFSEQIPRFSSHYPFLRYRHVCQP